MQLFRLAGALLLFAGCVFATVPPGPAGNPIIRISISDQADQPLAGVRVELKAGQEVVASAETDTLGHTEFGQLKPGSYSITATKRGFESLQRGDLLVSPSGSIALELTLVPTLERHESIEVHESVAPLEQSSSPSVELSPQTVTELPSRPATVADALPLVPGVVRSPEGGLQISGSKEYRSALIVNSADVTDPATGQFGLTVPIDSVDTLNVFQTPFVAEYGRFTAGLVSVETRRGGERWRWSLNDPFPDFRIRSWQMTGIKDATPRLNVDGPLIPGKLYLSEGFEYEIRKTSVFTLPFPDNQKLEEGVNSFTQLDWIVSSRQLVTGTIHIAPQRMDFVNLNAFNPEPTTPDASMRNYTATVADRLTVKGGLFENTLSATRFDASVWGQGSQDLTFAPQGNSGNYFAQQNRTASRLALLSTYSFAPLNLAGTHNFKVGSDIAGSSDQGQVSDHPVDILNSNGQLLEHISFTGGQPYRMTDQEFAFFGQDHWIISPRLAMDIGVRAESQSVSETFRLAPRVGIAWSPLPSLGTVLHAGFGLFYDRVPLNVYAFRNYPSEVVTSYDSAGQITAGPFLYQNDLGELGMPPRLVFQEPVAGNFSPRSSTWSVSADQPVTRFLKLRASYMQNDSSGLIILNPVAPDPATSTGAYLLSGTGGSRYRQLELTARVRLGSERELFFSYVRSRAQGNLNEFGSYLGSFPTPIIRPDQYGNLPSDLPNRFLLWGTARLGQGFRLMPLFEYRSGFPYAVLDASQNYFGTPYQTRYPNFFSLDARLSKDIKVSPKYTIRLSVSTFNLTDHFNPEAVHYNIADPLYGSLFGQHGRRFTADFDVIF